jgi:H+/Cl- antiporter ClcA
MQLAETSWQLVLQNPLFGSPNYLAYMEQLRQGQGIIDLVNAYATIALSFGLVGLGLFAAFFGSIILRCLKAARPLIELDLEFNLVGVALVATLVATLAMLFTVNLYMSIGALAWVLGGMGVAYSRLAKAALPLDTGVRTEPELAPMRMSSQQSRLRGTVQ